MSINYPQYELEEEDMTYPKISVSLDPGDVPCSDVDSDDTSCVAIIDKEDVYTVIFTLSDGSGSTLGFFDGMLHAFKL